MTNQIYSQSVLTFYGQDNYIDFGKNDFGGVFAKGSSAFTISGWVNPHQLANKATTYGTRNVFFARSSDRYSDNFEFGISESGNLDVFIDETLEKKIKTFGNGGTKKQSEKSAIQTPPAKEGKTETAQIRETQVPATSNNQKH